jgi:hypothetical protein
LSNNIDKVITLKKYYTYEEHLNFHDNTFNKIIHDFNAQHLKSQEQSFKFGNHSKLILSRTDFNLMNDKFVNGVQKILDDEYNNCSELFSHFTETKGRKFDGIYIIPINKFSSLTADNRDFRGIPYTMLGNKLEKLTYKIFKLYDQDFVEPELDIIKGMSDLFSSYFNDADTPEVAISSLLNDVLGTFTKK